ncbi:MAG: gamma-glutamyl-gamma-aminobutyrate hydrolase family protein [Candidatus Pacearchaeota archaeon]|nr:gamma-glutamyl-gamma-aminobutyrate hydrolase family protein [Candidatus Pacearchaeota archaeon]
MILIINICKERLHYYEFVRPIEDILNKNNIEFESYHSRQLTERIMNRAKKIIICGTSLKDNRFLSEVEKFRWIEKYDKPILGICAGMQIIGFIFGGKLKKDKEIGLEKVNFRKEFLSVKGERDVYTLHGNSIEFGDDFEVFAKTKDCVQAVKHKYSEIYGVLFHPEVRNKIIIERFCKI